MRKLSIFAAGFMAATIVLLSTGVAMADPPKEEFDAKNQVKIGRASCRERVY